MTNIKSENTNIY